MTTLAAIEGQLVSIKNVSTHKSACLVIHVPEECALKVIDAFGWPTMAAPVPVAIARLDPNAKPEKPKGGKLAQQSGILCNEGRFARFLIEEHYSYFNGVTYPSASMVADFIREHCIIESRAELDHNPEAARKFQDLVASYEAWKIAA